MDFCNEYEAENNLIMVFVRAGITKEILESSREILTLENLTHRYKKKLMSSYFLQESAVEMGLTIILSSLEINCSQAQSPENFSNSTPISTPVSNGGQPSKVYTNTIGIKFQYIPDDSWRNRPLGFRGWNDRPESEKCKSSIQYTRRLQDKINLFQ
jgi:hypothetical protein